MTTPKVTWTKGAGQRPAYTGVVEGSDLVAELIDITCGDYELYIRNAEGEDLFFDFGCNFASVAPAQAWAERELARILHPTEKVPSGQCAPTST